MSISQRRNLKSTHRTTPSLNASACIIKPCQFLSSRRAPIFCFSSIPIPSTIVFSTYRGGLDEGTGDVAADGYGFSSGGSNGGGGSDGGGGGDGGGGSGGGGGGSGGGGGGGVKYGFTSPPGPRPFLLGLYLLANAHGTQEGDERDRGCRGSFVKSENLEIRGRCC
uniref:Uncharacterized protein n=1 Tax=Vespula pensylvanica TaxID=30213 RepID=A0A834P6D3_VESPE|nr:hypothetical protein H0235_006336 [Vespula pensylvanica]